MRLKLRPYAKAKLSTWVCLYAQSTGCSMTGELTFDRSHGERTLSKWEHASRTWTLFSAPQTRELPYPSDAIVAYNLSTSNEMSVCCVPVPTSIRVDRLRPKTRKHARTSPMELKRFAVCVVHNWKLACGFVTWNARILTTKQCSRWLAAVKSDFARKFRKQRDWNLNLAPLRIRPSHVNYDPWLGFFVFDFWSTVSSVIVFIYLVCRSHRFSAQSN